MHSTPAHLQRDPAKQAGQIVNPIPMTDQEVYRFMNPSKAYKPVHGGRPDPKQDGTLGDYLRRKEDNHAGMPVSEGEAFCSRIMR